MPRKTVTKKSTRRAPRKAATKKKTVLLAETPVFDVAKVSEVSRVSEVLNRERKIIIQQMDSPPVSPYVIDFRHELTADRLPLTAPIEEVAPTMAEELAIAEASNKLQVTPKESLRLPTGQASNKEVDWSPAPAIEVVTSNKRQVTRDRIRIPKFHFPELHLPKFNFPKFKLPSLELHPTRYTLRPNLRPALAFALIALLFIMPAAGLEAYTKLDQTKNALAAKTQTNLGGLELPKSLAEAPSALTSVKKTFAQTKTDLEKSVGIFDKILPLIPRAGKTYRSGKLLLDAGAHLSEAGRIVTEGLTAQTAANTALTTRIINLEESLHAAFPLVAAADLELQDTSEKSLPAKLAAAIPSLRSAISDIRLSFAQTLEILPSLENFLGLEQTKRYLVIFQNTNELRPTGGFIGSYALVDVDRGEIKIVDVPGGGSYDLAGGLTKHIIAPQPLSLIEPHWQFHDANWFADFPTSASKLMWFYGKSGGPSVDGVIAINSSVVPELLKILGPVEMPAYGRTFTADNFVEETQKIVELEYNRAENKPKKLIGELAPVLLDRLLAATPDQSLELFGIFGNSMRNKDIQLFSTDREIQSAFSSAGWTGELHETNGDYLAVVSTNIAGGKTSGVIDTKINHRSTIADDGSIVDRLDITRTHNGEKGDLFTGIRNVEYLRVYVPIGSELIGTSGFEPPRDALFQKADADYVLDEDLRPIIASQKTDPSSRTLITNESGKTVFGNWVQLDPGKTQTISLTYRLPKRLVFDQKTVKSRLKSMLGIAPTAPYSLVVDRQSGLKSTFETSVIFPKSWKVRWSQKTDQFNGILFSR